MKDFFRKKMEEACPKYSKEYEEMKKIERYASYLGGDSLFGDIEKEIKKHIPEDWEYGKDYTVETKYSKPECNSKGEFHMSAKINIVKK